MVFLNQVDAFKYLLKNLDGTDNSEINISTYGLYLGISKGQDWTEKYTNITRKVVDKFNEHNLKIIVGIPYFTECKPDCCECRESYNEKLKRLQDTVDMLHLNVRFHPELHWKYYQVNDCVISGGMNLTDSTYTDTAFIIENENDKKKLKELFNKTWDEGFETVVSFYKGKTEFEPATEKQLDFIKIISKRTGVLFDGTSKKEASAYITKYKNVKNT